MITDSDNKILKLTDEILDLEISADNLRTAGFEYFDNEVTAEAIWEVTYKGRGHTLHIAFKWGGGCVACVARIPVTHYTSSTKASWTTCVESAHTIREIFDWFDKEEEFYKDHPEEEPGNPLYEMTRKRNGLIVEEMRNIIDEIEKNKDLYKGTIYLYPDGTVPSVDGPIYNDDSVWMSVYEKAAMRVNEKYPELMV